MPTLSPPDVSLDALKRALDLDELRVFYQPQFALDVGGYSSIEALVRWRHPTRGLLGPAAFLGLAESAGLMSQVTDFVLAKACRDAANWPGIAVAVNISPAEFNDALLASRLERALGRWGFPPERLVVEIVESAGLGDPVRAIAVARELRSMGVRLAIDDFGVGFSSLSLLRRIPFDLVKIDKSFVDAIPEPRSTAIIRSIIGLAHTLGAKVVGEGVETQDQARFLNGAQCDYLQGFLFSRPIEASDVATKLSESPAALLA